MKSDAMQTATDFLLARKRAMEESVPEWMPVMQVYIGKGKCDFRATMHPVFFDNPEGGLAAIAKIRQLLDRAEADISARLKGKETDK